MHHKIKENIAHMESFSRRHLAEILSVCALIAGLLSAWKGFFYSGMALTLLFFVIGAVLGIFFPMQMDKMLKKMYHMTHRRGRIQQIIVGVVQIAIAILVPFIYFGMMGLLAGSASHYFNRIAQNWNDKSGDRAA